MATNVIRKGLNRRWEDIRRLSRSGDEFDRTSALAHAVACLEIGLGAIGIAPDRTLGVQARLQEAIAQLSLRRLPPIMDIKSAFQARNRAVHEHKVPSSKMCQQHISTFHKLWNSMRSTFVTREQAGRLAASILQTPEISKVFLFGSLAHRNRTRPRDIDLLLFDKGEFSAFGAGYARTDLSILEGYFDVLSDPSAIRCGWLDLIIIDGCRFGTDSDYTLSLASRH